MGRTLAGWIVATAASTEVSIVVKATVILVAALIATRLARRARASLRHLWLASAFGALLLLPAATSLMPRFVLQVPATPAGDSESTARLLGGPQGMKVETPAVAVSSSMDRPPARVSVVARIRLVWGFGALLCLVPLSAALVRTRQIRRRGLPYPDGERLVRQLARDAGLNRSVSVLLDDQLPAPMTCGFVAPTIMLPAGIHEWADADVRRAVVHELEHVRRADWPVHLMARVACALYWFHPLAWVAWRQLCLDSERACDDAVLTGSEGSAYADQLLRLARQLLADRTEAALSMANRSDLAARVTAVLDQRRSRGRVELRSIVVASVVTIMCLLAISSLTAVSAKGGQDSEGAWRADETDHFSVFSSRSAADSQTDEIKRDVERAYNVVAIDLRHDIPFRPTLLIFDSRAQSVRASTANELVSSIGGISPVDQRVLVALDMSPDQRKAELARQIRAMFERHIASSRPRAQASSPAAGEPSPAFEVASVKQNKSRGFGMPQFVVEPGGRLTVTNMPLEMLIRQAYQLGPVQLTGGPAWMGADRFDVVAKADRELRGGAGTIGPLQLMLQSLLADRFKLRAHAESKDIPRYELGLARADGGLGPQLHVSDLDCEMPPPGQRPCNVLRATPGLLIGGGVLLSAFGRGLSAILQAPVIDRTGLAGRFDFNLTWTPDTPAWQGVPVPVDPGSSSIFPAIREQLGLNLEYHKGRVDVLVVDSVEHLTED